MLDLTELWDEEERLHRVAQKVAAQLSRDRINCDLEANPFAVEFQINFREVFLYSISGRSAANASFGYREWLKEQKIGQYPIAYEDFGTWPEEQSERAKFSAAVRTKVSNALSKYELESNLPSLSELDVRP